MVIVELKGTDGKIVGVLTAQPKEFKTGSRGFFATGKVQIEGKKYQAQIQLVEIGSKPTDQATETKNENA